MKKLYMFFFSNIILLFTCSSQDSCNVSLKDNATKNNIEEINHQKTKTPIVVRRMPKPKTIIL